ncbi:MAG: hypothetical protein ACRDJH_20090 [Thermomicrobiales bacterium]
MVSSRDRWPVERADGLTPVARPFASKPARRGPAPFSTEWNLSPPEPEPSRRLPVLPSWFPSDSGFAGVLVVLLTLAVAIGGRGFGLAAGGDDGKQRVPAVAIEATAPNAPTPTTTPNNETVAEPEAEPTTTFTAALNLEPPASAAVGGDDRGLLPRYRILSFYGHPNDPNMGIIGEYGKEELLSLLREEQAAYEAADPSRPVMPAFEVIATVAQDWPTDEGEYLLTTGEHIIDDYARFCEENGILLILDVQIAHSTVQEEIERVRPWLELPFVHLAIDPEFAMAEGEIPGQEIGGIDAADITYAQEALAEIAAENGLPSKLLIVHQFEEGMIRNAEQLAPVDGTQLIIEFDGYGEPANKIAGYNLFISDRPIEHGGIKLFYRQDAPMLTAPEVLALTPSPDVVIFQ